LLVSRHIAVWISCALCLYQKPRYDDLYHARHQICFNREYFFIIHLYSQLLHVLWNDLAKRWSKKML